MDEGGGRRYDELMRIASLAISLALLAGTVVAVDHPVGGDKLLLKDPADDGARRVTFKAARDPAIDPSQTADPRIVGGELRIIGSAPGDGSSGIIALDSSLWTGLGNPEGSKGYKFYDRFRGVGIKKVVFKPGDAGGSLIVAGGGANWPYAVVQAQGPIDVRFTIGADVYCARHTTFVRNEPGRVLARDAPPPASCGAPPPTTTSTTTTSITTTSIMTTTSTTIPGTCGNGVVDGLEECDDGGTTPGDGCSATCELESINPALCAGVPSVSGTGLDTVRIAIGLEAPVHVAGPRLDPSRVFIVEQPGRIQVVENGVQLPTPFLAIEGIVRYSAFSEEGLLSVAFDPDYETNRFFYVYYVNNAGDLVIARYEANPGNPNDALEASEHIIATISHPTNSNHNGGNLNFAPDGFLYAATGDGGSGGDPSDNAQNDASRLGKLLRIDVDTDTITTWAKGLRNPFRFSFDRANGDIYIGDVGQGSWEEIDYVAGNPMGINYGWDDMEGRHCFEPAVGCLTAGRVLPVLEYCNSGCAAPGDPDCTVAACSVFQSEKGQAVIGGFVYRGCAMPDVQGEYFYSDTYNTWIRSFRGVSGGNAQNLLNRTAELDPPGAQAITSVTSFGEDARGELYLTDYSDGEVYKIIPGP